MEAAEQRDWSALPPGVLQNIMCRASTWQAPGTCLAARVCSAWSLAAAGCSGIRLLYHVGDPYVDCLFASWLTRNSRQLGALTLTFSSDPGGPYGPDDDLVLAALTEAATAAQAEGRPLQLHTLRVLQWVVDVRAAGQLLAALPHLRCLQLQLTWPYESPASAGRGDLVRQALAPLQRATCLEELYLTGSLRAHGVSPDLLPARLRRLSSPPLLGPAFSASHLTQLTFLHLGKGWDELEFHACQLPPGLQQLELMDAEDMVSEEFMGVLEEQQQAVMSLHLGHAPWREAECLQQVSCLPKLTAAKVEAAAMGYPAAEAALKQLTKLSALTVSTEAGDFCKVQQGMRAAIAAAASMSSMRRLHLGDYPTVSDEEPPQPAALIAPTQLTQLRLSRRPWTDEEQEPAWSVVLCSADSLRWLSVPSGLLAAGLASLGSLHHLQVLVVCCEREREGAAPTSSMPWVEGCSQEAVPPSLRLFCLKSLAAWEAHRWEVRRRLRQALGSSCCEVVVGSDLDELADPTQQLAGVPQGLHQLMI